MPWTQSPALNSTLHTPALHVPLHSTGTAAQQQMHVSNTLMTFHQGVWVFLLV
jgi:hypothetical protein